MLSSRSKSVISLSPLFLPTCVIALTQVSITARLVPSHARPVAHLHLACTKIKSNAHGSG